MRTLQLLTASVALAPALLLVLLVLLAAPARASSFYPGEVQSHVGAKSLPACTLCHKTLLGGFGTATQPFGVSVRAHGGVAQSASALDAALDKMAADGTDSDGDCVGDIAELKAGTDPNSSADNPGACGDAGPRPGGGPVSATPIPEYGCAMTTSPVEEGPAPFALGAALVAWVVLRRRRA